MLDRKDLRRVAVIATTVVIIVVLIIWKYFSLMVVGPPHRSPGRGEVTVERGPILDRNGRILAIDTRQYSVTAWVPFVHNKQRDARLLSGILGIPAHSLLTTLSTHRGFVYVKRDIPDPQSAQIRALIKEGKLTGISLMVAFARLYPNGDLASHVLGYVGTDNQGLAGIEYSFNNDLMPTPRAGSRRSAGSAHKELFGDQVFLTLNENVEYEAEKLAGRLYKKVHPRAIIVFVVQAKTGDILADVSYPEFNPNNFARYSAKVREDYPISYIYEPGSVLKIFTLSSFLQLGGITPKTKFYDNGYYVHRLPGGRIIRIHGLAPHEWEDAQLIIKWSSNVGAAYASDTVSKTAFYRMLRAFGFGRPTYVSLPGEATGILRPVSQWTPRSKPTIAFGQEIGTTAMQVVAAATALANGGVLLKPHIVSRIATPSGKIVESFPREPIRRVISAKVAREMLSFMETGTEPGAWAHGARLKGIPVSAKTGTSQVYDPKTGTYSKTDYVGSSISIFPTNNPRFIVYAAVIDPKTTHYWGFQVATPLVHKVSAFLAAHFDLRSNNQRIVAAPHSISLRRGVKLSIGRTVPNLVGLSKRELLPLLSDPHVRVHIHGYGWVVKQTPAPGTPMSSNMKVSVVLR